MNSDKVTGGKGDKASPVDFSKKEIKIGVAVELEHTKDKKIALEIALDHLSEDPHYYSKLVKKDMVDEPEAIKIANEAKLKELLTLKIQNILDEGINDPNILKAVFLIGGAGSGKTFVGSSIFGISDVTPSLSATGLKVLSSDIAFEHMLKKLKISPSELINMSKEEFKNLTVGPNSPRARAKQIRNAQYNAFTSGRLGLIIDGTGMDYQKIKNKKAALENLGYDTYMVMVSTTLPVALARNRQRDRKLPEDIVKQIWRDVNALTPKYKSLFKGNMSVVNNSEKKPVPDGITKSAMSFLRHPVKNSIGQKWIKVQQILKKSL